MSDLTAQSFITATSISSLIIIVNWNSATGGRRVGFVSVVLFLLSLGLIAFLSCESREPAKRLREVPFKTKPSLIRLTIRQGIPDLLVEVMRQLYHRADVAGF